MKLVILLKSKPAIEAALAWVKRSSNLVSVASDMEIRPI